MVDDTRLASLKSAGDFTERSARVDFLGRSPDGKIVVQGRCEGGRNIGDIPDLILITAQAPSAEELIVAFQAPITPSDFFNDSDRRHRLEDHYEGWRVMLDQLPVPEAPGTLLRAYAFGSDKRIVRRIQGEFPVPRAP